ncbi:MAG: DUF421 domain-containing protein [Clostridia bacterium]|nr:DUF421 domain-containing protein [Clostridia bacterium]
MAITFIRTTIIFSVLLILIRLMGKRQIGEMQPFEFIVTLIIADLACVPMADVSIPLIYGIVAVVTLFGLHQLLSLIEQMGGFAKKVISGKPSVVINKNGVDLYELKRNNMGVEDLIESMRSAGYFAFDELDYAIFESNGKLSALKSQNSQESQSVPLLIVNDGNIHNSNLKLVNLDKSRVTDFLKSKGKSLKNTEVLTVDGKGKAYLKMKNSPFEISEFPLPQGVQW